MPTSKLGNTAGCASGEIKRIEVTRASAARALPTTMRCGFSFMATLGRLNNPAKRVGESVPTISTEGSRLRKNRSRVFSTFQGKCSNLTHRATEWLQQPSFLDLKRQGIITKRSAS